MDHMIYPAHPAAQTPFLSPLRVAAYIRVSTDHGRQEDSHETQNAYFSKLLADNPHWVSAGIYSDYGISGTSKERRTGFNRLLRHCTEGRIDHIVTKSISRFARNTRDFLKVLDILKENHVTIAFEKEHLDTAVAQNDLLLTIFGAIAQEESRSISANIITGLRHRYPRGETKNIVIYGYRYKHGNNAIQIMDSGYTLRQIEVLEREAAIVRRVFHEAIDGNSFIKIARRLNDERIPAPGSAIRSKRSKMAQTPAGILNTGLDEGWTSRHIKQILRLERYCGDVLLQKTYKPDHKSHKVVPNKGELQQYYVKNHHPPIIDRKTFQKAQKILEINARQYGRRSAQKKSYPLSGKLVCSHCGRFYHTRNRHKRAIWFCASTKQNNGKMVCRAERIYEEQILQMIQTAAIDRFLLPHPLLTDTHPDPDPSHRRYTSIDNPHTSMDPQKIGLILEKMKQIQMADTMELDRVFLQTQTQERKDRTPLEDQIRQLEQYWSALEDGYECRKNSIAWLQTLPGDKQGILHLLKGLTGTYIKAFVLSIEIETPTRYRIHWFDNTWTNIRIDT